MATYLHNFLRMEMRHAVAGVWRDVTDTIVRRLSTNCMGKFVLKKLTAHTAKKSQLFLTDIFSPLKFSFEIHFRITCHPRQTFKTATNSHVFRLKFCVHF